MSNTTQNEHAVSANIVSGFVSNGEGGNPAGVVLEADRLSEDQMLNVAAKLGLSETAFVSASETEGFKLDFFTPTRRIAHCGHATIATFSYMAEQGLVGEGTTSKETVDGPRSISIKDGMAFMEQLAPKYRFPSQWVSEGVKLDEVLFSLGLATDDLDEKVSPVLVNTGNSFIVIGVKNGEALQSLTPNFNLMEQISEKLDLIGYYVFTTDSNATDKDATTRMFAPRYGIEEESATGMAAGPLACVLHDFLDGDKTEFQIEQGKFMHVPSVSSIHVDLSINDNKISGLMAGGKGKMLKQVVIDI